MIFAGLMLTAEGPRLIEYNVRLGDPEAQTVLPLVESDLAELALAAANGSIADVAIVWAATMRRASKPRIASMLLGLAARAAV